MQLSVPKRTVADTGSFPVNPEDVAQWLIGLDPMESEADAREVYRGLKHSNRLHNDVDQRRSVISCFVPTLRDLQRQLSELSNAQPLPLTREFARSARLRESLLREEAFAFKILVSDSREPLADDARRAMQALARQAESIAHAYREFPEALIQDAHQLYALSEKHKLVSAQVGPKLLSLQDHYRFILLLSMADLSQQRVRQLPLLIDFLKHAVSGVSIEKQRISDEITVGDYAIDLTRGSRPEPAHTLLYEEESDIRWFNIASVLYRIDRASSRTKGHSVGMLGSDILEHQSLARLHIALIRTRPRRLARSISFEPQRVVFGHKEICAYLLYRPAEVPADGESGWHCMNQSQQGMCLRNLSCRAGLVQVGEIVSVTTPETALVQDTEQTHGKIGAQLGVIRWIRAIDEDGIVMGVEFLARTVLPVHVTRRMRDASSSDTDVVNIVNEAQVGENALIIACKVRDQVLQTILLPSHLYHTGERLIASQGANTRHVVLSKCLQNNGLFSQFSLVDG